MPKSVDSDVQEREHSCHLCFKNFLRKHHLQAHLRSHTDERPHKCIFCVAKFKNKFHLNRHHYTLHKVEYQTWLAKEEKSWKCSFCAEIFMSQSLLTRHINSVHQDKEAFTCPWCYKPFRTLSVLQAHMPKHSTLRKYACTKCRKSYKYPADLHNHMKIHSGVIRCTQCGRACSTKSQLRNHMVTHTGAKNFMCTHCGCAFMRQQNLRRHEQLHTIYTQEQVAHIEKTKASHSRGRLTKIEALDSIHELPQESNIDEYVVAEDDFSIMNQYLPEQELDMLVSNEDLQCEKTTLSVRLCGHSSVQITEDHAENCNDIEEIIFEENISKVDTSLQNVPQNIETHNTNEAITGQNDGNNETALDVRTQHTLETEMKELIGQNELNGLMQAFPKSETITIQYNDGNVILKGGKVTSDVPVDTYHSKLDSNLVAAADVTSSPQVVRDSSDAYDVPEEDLSDVQQDLLQLAHQQELLHSEPHGKDIDIDDERDHLTTDCHTNIVIPFTAIERDLPMSLTPECDMSGGDCEWKMTSDTVPITAEVGNATMAEPDITLDTESEPKIIQKRTVGHNTEGDNNVNDSIISISNGHYSCAVCQKEFQRTDTIRAHIYSRHTNIRPYKCLECTSTFCRAETLRIHMQRHRRQQSYSCQFCIKTFKSDVFKLKHERVKHYKELGIPPEQCVICLCLFPGRTRLHNHLKSHSQEIPHHCIICQQKFDSLDLHLTHMDIHTKAGTLYLCSDCEFSCVDFGEFSTHQKMKHPSNFTCQLCSQEFLDECKLLDHARMEHKGKYLSCEKCQQTFSHKARLEKHNGSKMCNNEMKNLKNNVKLDIVCDICGKTYSSLLTLRQHHRSHKPDGETHDCSVCGKWFRLKTSLNRHLVKHQSMEVSNANRIKKLVCPTRQYRCLSCNVTYKRLQHYQAHVFQHLHSLMQDDNVSEEKVVSQNMKTRRKFLSSQMQNPKVLAKLVEIVTKDQSEELLETFNKMNNSGLTESKYASTENGYNETTLDNDSNSSKLKLFLNSVEHIEIEKLPDESCLSKDQQMLIIVKLVKLKLKS